MSYDLYYLTTQTEPIGAEELSGYLTALTPHFERIKVEGGIQYFYQNEETGVYFSLDWSEPGSEDLPPIPDGVHFAGLSFNLNFIRPTFFALEAMPVVEAIAERFGLLVMDPQDHEIGGSSLPKKGVTDELVAAWQKSNAWAIAALRSQGETAPYMPRSQSTLLWRYQAAKQRLQETYADAFVPKQFILREAATGRLFTAITWGDCIPELFPPCDLILCGRQRNRFFGLIKGYDMGVISYAELIQAFAPFLEEAPGDIPQMKVLREGRHKEAQPVFDALPRRSFDRRTYVGVGLDGFVDEPG